MIRLNDQRYWLAAAVDPKPKNSATSSFFRVKRADDAAFFQELEDRHEVVDATFSVDNHRTLRDTLDRLGLKYRHETRGRRYSVERICKDAKLRTEHFTYISVMLTRLRRNLAPNPRRPVEEANLNDVPSED